MYRRLIRFLFGDRHDIDLDLAEGRIAPVEICAYGPEDFSACRELYVLNESGRFPAGALSEFEATLRKGSQLFLVAKKDRQICGCGGVGVRKGPTDCAAWLSYGLIHPKYQNQGFGTTLLLARLSLIPSNVPFVGMSPVPASRGFYERFNFREVKRFTHSSGVELPIHFARLSPSILFHCENLLANAGIVLPPDLPSVPVISE
jgi:ribosomal protein S18 acetylase RimI-like enzyme